MKTETDRSAHGRSTPPARGEIDVDGLRIRYRRAGKGPPLLLLHGFFGDSFGFVVTRPGSLFRTESGLSRGVESTVLDGLYVRRHSNGGKKHTTETRAKIAETLRRRSQDDRD